MRNERTAPFSVALESENIDLREISRLANFGVPDGLRLRPIYWKLMLGYLPTDRKLWESTLKDMRDLYDTYVHQFFIKVRKSTEDVCVDPLSDEPINDKGPSDSAWAEYQKNAKLLIEIDKDVRRTHPMVQFFRCDPEYLAKFGVTQKDIGSYQSNVGDKSPAIKFSSLTNNSEKGTIFNPPERNRARLNGLLTDFDRLANGTFGGILDKPQVSQHHAALVRMLMLFARLNTAIQYVQGLNELVSMIYYVFYTECEPEERQYAEADAFWCFVNLMSAVGDIYTVGLDGDVIGIRGHMSRLMKGIEARYPACHKHLSSLGIPADFFAIRWFTLLLAGEFELPDAVRVWDTVLGGRVNGPDGVMDRLQAVCVTMIGFVEDDLLQCGYSETITMLQKYPVVDVNHLLGFAVPKEVTAANNVVSNSEGPASPGGVEGAYRGF
ncbi:Rab-GTPase-TBC domain [Carpediemonas membranifera]|uniref:Rab-GTPase-TBC domain n=1 Tax=Carpediemonas membranifera TaxID=201153 RepID=A0A8J6E351_9EUKA|nr:Rab-GTPase-TBC domain [Carpediemonas membranifera]|eukprot:KAG9395483.1 Rab-GTPase-TBC domain [Carpediemonas membranifera]